MTPSEIYINEYSVDTLEEQRKRRQRVEHKGLIAKLGPTRIYCSGCDEQKVCVLADFPERTLFNGVHVDATMEVTPKCKNCGCPVPESIPYIQWMLDTYFSGGDIESP